MPLKDPRAEKDLQTMHALSPTTSRAMFGGYGFYSEGGPMFALYAIDQTYFKVDDQNRAAFEEVGGGPFIWTGGDAPMAMSYYSIPKEDWNDSAKLRSWMELGQAAAERAALKKAKKKR